MNKRVEIPFGLGVDRHNRVPQEGGPMLRATRNLLLDDQNELVRRKSMEFRQTVVRSNQTTGGLIGTLSSNLDEDGALASVLKQPLCLWLPPFVGGNGDGNRHNMQVFRAANGENTLLARGNAHVMRLPASPRRPQSLFWRGGLWIAAGDAMPVPTFTTAAAPSTGLARIGVYTQANGLPLYSMVAGMGVLLDAADTWQTFVSPNLVGDELVFYTEMANAFRPRCIGSYRGRMVLSNFPDGPYGSPRRNGILFSDYLSAPHLASGTPAAGYYTDNIEVPVFGASSVSVFGEEGRLFLVGDDGEEIIGHTELSLQQSGAMNQAALIIFKDRSIWLMTGETLGTEDVGEVRGDAVFLKQPVEDGCASFETVCETPWGIIWAGHDDVYFMPNGGGGIIPIGRRIASQLKHTPFDMQWMWHAAYHEGYYRLSVMAPGQRQDAPIAMEETWCLDLRYGPPTDWTKARWFGPQVYQPIGAVNGDSDDIYRGLFCTAVEKRVGYKKELFALQAGKDGEVDNYAWVMCSLDGEDTRDWSLPFSPTMYRITTTTEALEVGEKRAVAEASWTHGRQKTVSVAGTSGAGEPDWTDDDTTADADGAVTWTAGGKIATPSNFNISTTNDGEDGVPTVRGNEVLCLIRSMEFPSDRPNGDVQFRGLEVGASKKDATAWSLQALKDQLHEGLFNSYEGVAGNFILGRTALGERINDPIAPFAMWMDARQSYDNLVIGKHVSFALGESPFLVITSSEYNFSFYFDSDGNGSADLLVEADLSYTDATYGFTYLTDLLDAVVAAMNAALTAAGLPGTFGHNLTNNPATCPVKPTITHSSRAWIPNCYTTGFEVVGNAASPALWLQLGFDPIGPGVYNGTALTTNTAPNSPWQRKVPKLRIASLTAVLRSFRRGPT